MCWAPISASGVPMRLGDGLLAEGGGDEHAPFGLDVGIADIDLQQKAVELGFGQRIGAFLFQRILRRQHMERPRQVVALAGDRDVLFLHRLQQRRLRARAGAVDFVGHQQLGEDGALEEAERAAPAVAFLQHFRADDVGRHQIGRELDALPVETKDDAQRLDQAGLGKAGHADKQAMPACQQRHQGLIDHFVLAEDDAADAFAHFGEEGRRRLGMGDGCAVVRRFGDGWNIGHIIVLSGRPMMRRSCRSTGYPKLPVSRPALMLEASAPR